MHAHFCIIWIFFFVVVFSGGVTLFDATNQGFVDGIITSTISLSYGSSTDFVPVVLEPLEMANGLVYDGEFDNHEDIANLGTGMYTTVCTYTVHVYTTVLYKS